jgi:hypothetical protein
MRAWVIAGLVGMALAACGDEETMTVRGRLLWPDGTPAADYSVEYTIDFQRVETTTDAEGRYRATLPRGDEYASAELAFYRVDPIHAEVTVSRAAGAGTFDVPDLSLWEARLTATVRDAVPGDAQLDWQPGPYQSFQLGVEDASFFGPGIQWRAVVAANDYLLPAQVFEDHDAYVTLSAEKELGGGFVARASAGGAEVHSSQTISLARGAPCTMNGHRFLDADGEPFCPATDRLYHPVEGSCEGDCGDPTELVIDLGRVTRVSSVVIHGLTVSHAGEARADIAVSEDGTAYETVGRVEAPWVTVPLAAPVETRFIRLSTRPGDTFVTLNEIGVF